MKRRTKAKLRIAGLYLVSTLAFIHAGIHSHKASKFYSYSSMRPKMSIKYERENIDSDPNNTILDRHDLIGRKINIVSYDLNKKLSLEDLSSVSYAHKMIDRSRELSNKRDSLEIELNDVENSEIYRLTKNKYNKHLNRHLFYAVLGAPPFVLAALGSIVLWVTKKGGFLENKK